MFFILILFMSLILNLDSVDGNFIIDIDSYNTRNATLIAIIVISVARINAIYNSLLLVNIIQVFFHILVFYISLNIYINYAGINHLIANLSDVASYRYMILNSFLICSVICLSTEAIIYFLKYVNIKGSSPICMGKPLMIELQEKRLEVSGRSNPCHDIRKPLA